MVSQFRSVRDIPSGLWHWPHFKPEELRCKGSGSLLIDTEFMARIEALRRDFGYPMIVNSWYRTPEHNRAVASTGDDGPHTTGRAVDVRVYGPRALKLIELAVRHGFTGVGVDQRSSVPLESRYIHLDDLEEGPNRPRPWIWSY